MHADLAIWTAPRLTLTQALAPLPLPPPPPHTPLIPQDPLDLSGRNLAAFDHVQRGLVADAEDRAAEEVRCALCAVRCALCAVRCAV